MCYRRGFCPNLYDLVQEMGRVNRLQCTLRGADTYYTYLNVTSYIMMWVRGQRQVNPVVCARHLTNLFQVLQFNIIPSRCMHEVVEEWFEILKRM